LEALPSTLRISHWSAVALRQGSHSLVRVTVRSDLGCYPVRERDVLFSFSYD
jgi:hypothetical protein